MEIEKKNSLEVYYDREYFWECNCPEDYLMSVDDTHCWRCGSQRADNYRGTLVTAPFVLDTSGDSVWGYILLTFMILFILVIALLAFGGNILIIGG